MASVVRYEEGSVQFLITYLVVFFASNFYKSGLYITIYFGHGNVSFDVFWYLVF